MQLCDDNYDQNDGYTCRKKRRRKSSIESPCQQYSSGDERQKRCIKYEQDEQENAGDTEAYLIDKYIQIYKSFSDERTAEFIKLYFGNNAINTTELSNILPIYL